MALESANLDGLSERVLRIRVSGGTGDARLPTGLGLFEGAMTDTQLRNFRKGELPTTLAQRKVATVTWRATDELSTLVAPSVPLEPGQTYTLASRTSGQVGTFVVDEEDSLAILNRVWPPSGILGQANYAVYCGQAGVSVEPISVVFEPGNISARLRSGIDEQGLFSERCVSFELSGSSPSQGVLIPPPLLGNVLLDPSPIELADPEPIPALECTASEVSLGPGCATVLDDRVVLRSADVPLFWIVRGPTEVLAEAVESGATLVLRGFSPGSTQTIVGSAIDRFGERFDLDAAVQMQAATSHLVLNEVLADPQGAEPAQEWIELFNDGARMESLSDYVLEDGKGKLELPAAEILPGEFALIVAEAFDESSASDVTVVSGTKLVRLPKLGNGLSNSGESLRLIARDGSVISEFPAAKPKPGVSIARRNAWESGADPAMFGLHAAPGASPGAANQLLEQ